MNILYDAASHFAAGIGLSVLDYGIQKKMAPKEERIEQKKECIEAIVNILDSNDEKLQGQLDPKSVQYAHNISTVREYLTGTNQLALDQGVVKNTADSVNRFFTRERLAHLSPKGLFKAALGLEIADSVVGMGYYMYVAKQSPIIAITDNLWEMPSLYAGLLVGRQVRNGINWALISGEERELNKTINQSLIGTPILDFVSNYEPTQEVLEETSDFDVGVRLTGAGKGIYKKLEKAGTLVTGAARDAVDYVANSGDRAQAREEERLDNVKKSFDKHTDGY